MLYRWTDDESDPRFPYQVRHRDELEKATGWRGRPLDLVALPTPRVYWLHVVELEGLHGGCADSLASVTRFRAAASSSL